MTKKAENITARSASPSQWIKANWKA